MAGHVFMRSARCRIGEVARNWTFCTKPSTAELGYFIPYFWTILIMVIILIIDFNDDPQIFLVPRAG